MSTVAVEKALEERTQEASRSTRVSAVWLTVETLALSLWLGGLLVIGAVVAPVAFHAMRSAPVLAGNPLLQNTMAGSIVGGSLKVLNDISIFCGMILIFCNEILKRQSTFRRNLWMLGLVGAYLTLMFQVNYLFPAMDTAQAVGNMVRFDSMHHAYVYISYIQIICLLIYTYKLNQIRLKTNS
jgi:hypothetical protein